MMGSRFCIRPRFTGAARASRKREGCAAEFVRGDRCCLRHRDPSAGRLASCQQPACPWRQYAGAAYRTALESAANVLVTSP
jgi:hypothetical protein